jgi:hypothetical protein
MAQAQIHPRAVPYGADDDPKDAEGIALMRRSGAKVRIFHRQEDRSAACATWLVDRTAGIALIAESPPCLP